MSKKVKVVSTFLSEENGIFLLQDIENARDCVKRVCDEFSSYILDVCPPSYSFSYYLVKRALEKINELYERIEDLCVEDEEGKRVRLLKEEEEKKDVAPDNQ